MSMTLDKPLLYTLREVAPLLGLCKPDDYRVVSGLIRLHKLTPRLIQGNRHPQLDRADVERLLRIYGKQAD